MSTIGKRSIYVGPADGSNNKPLNVEGLLTVSTAKPGTILEAVPGGLRVSQKNSTVFFRELIVADKDQQRAKSVDDVWVQNETIVGIKARSGEFLNVLVAAGNDITEHGTPLSVNGAGILQISDIPVTVGATLDWAMCYSDEIINVTGTDALVRVRVA